MELINDKEDQDSSQARFEDELADIEQDPVVSGPPSDHDYLHAVATILSHHFIRPTFNTRPGNFVKRYVDLLDRLARLFVTRPGDDAAAVSLILTQPSSKKYRDDITGCMRRRTVVEIIYTKKHEITGDEHKYYGALEKLLGVVEVQNMEEAYNGILTLANKFCRKKIKVLRIGLAESLRDVDVTALVSSFQPNDAAHFLWNIERLTGHDKTESKTAENVVETFLNGVKYRDSRLKGKLFLKLSYIIGYSARMNTVIKNANILHKIRRVGEYMATATDITTRLIKLGPFKVKFTQVFALFPSVEWF